MSSGCHCRFALALSDIDSDKHQLKVPKFVFCLKMFGQTKLESQIKKGKSLENCDSTGYQFSRYSLTNIFSRNVDTATRPIPNMFVNEWGLY